MSRTPGVVIVAVVAAVLFPTQIGSVVEWAIDTIGDVAVSGSTVAQADNAASKSAGLAALASVRSISQRPQVPGYERAEFGSRWTDNHAGLGGRNGCDTRNDILRSTLEDPTFKDGTRDCVVLTGTLAVEPYTGAVNVPFTKEKASALQVDHVVPLSLAWDLGANTWTPQKRADFANDQTLNLMLVDGPANVSKGDSPPSVWMPARKAFACQYASKFAVVAARYSLPLPKADIASLTDTLNGAC